MENFIVKNNFKSKTSKEFQAKVNEKLSNIIGKSLKTEQNLIYDFNVLENRKFVV